MIYNKRIVVISHEATIFAYNYYERYYDTLDNYYTLLHLLIVRNILDNLFLSAHQPKNQEHLDLYLYNALLDHLSHLHQ